LSEALKENKIMVKQIVRDVFFLGQKSELATKDDLQVGRDLQDTLYANRDRCVGMAANMIGVKKNIIIVNIGAADIVMFNPVLISKNGLYETEEGCLSLDGVRKTNRYREVVMEYFDFNWKKQKIKLKDWPAQIAQHEMDHLSGKVI
jgi:peptide deformylase